ncbi:hypothetical protein A1O3_03771 [Capronia epimyces CBS 606.96]|uniref:Major facilitator superfamily (MFS) profile domain-containing protein n=1 Tax=Capronia epimyces CBS 606.96 TaxID=1182542 RepID=W9Y1Y1_9EURO|nr:uncharacterized protein A1O3_03771 [Capronia epimyces CBS 606.96]EXJ86817.1 hypothetical protein A1O3_03771 [Capronia epimyces CBS 606.96]
MARVTLLQMTIVTYVALGSLTYGYCASIIATTLGQPSFLAYFNFAHRSNPTQIIGAINGLFQAGGFIGTMSCTVTADYLGRRKALLLGSCLSILGGALQAGSVNMTMYLIARFITGTGIGSLVTLVPLYQSEIAPPKIRGLLVGMHGVLICTGYSIASWVGLGFYFVHARGSQWRVPLAIQCIPPLILAAGTLFLPESPRWLLLQERVEDAYKAFKAVRAEASDPADEEAVRHEFNHLNAQLLQERLEAISFMDFLRKPSYRKRCFVGFMVQFTGQSTATQVINNYGPSLYSSLGFGTVQQLLIQSGWVTICPFGNYINALVVDRVGRVKMLVFGFTGCVLALIGEAITVSVYARTGERQVAGAAVFFLFMHITCYSISVDATTWIYASEIFPTPVRAKGMSVSISGLFVATIIYLQCAPTAFAEIGWKYYLVFICATAVMIPVVWFFFPETSQSSLEQIGAFFGDNVEVDDDIVPEKQRIQTEHIETEHVDKVAQEP